MPYSRLFNGVEKSLFTLYSSYFIKYNNNNIISYSKIVILPAVK